MIAQVKIKEKKDIESIEELKLLFNVGTFTKAIKLAALNYKRISDEKDEYFNKYEEIKMKHEEFLRITKDLLNSKDELNIMYDAYERTKL